MLDFVKIKTETKTGSKSLIISPEYITVGSRDLMIRGHDFYAVWNEEKGLWSKDEEDVIKLIDKMTLEYADGIDAVKQVKLLSEYGSGRWKEWHKYCKDHPDKYHELDSKIIFSNQKVNKTDYVTRTLPYPLEESPTPAYEEIISTLYEPSERQKIEWAIGAIISGDSKEIQKFLVLYGGPGTGKSTILNIISLLFDGYWSSFDSKALGSRNSDFALEDFKNNPLLAIEHDGDLSRIEDNTRLNSIVSHEELVINEKFKAKYTTKFHTLIFMGTNKPVKITDAKSGILRRLIDINPSGNKIKPKRYDELMEQVKFELGGIAYHCLKVYEGMGPKYYNSYVPLNMLSKTNDFFNFMEDNYIFFAQECGGGVPLNTAWMRYKEYCDDARVSYPLSKRLFKDELKNYFKEFKPRTHEYTNYYEGFLTEKFNFYTEAKKGEKNEEESWLKFNKRVSLFDKEFENCLAQYGNEEEKPTCPWSEVKTTLADIDTKKVHYIRLPKEIITVDFDLKDEDGNKSLDLNIEAASKWPETYAEVSKGGSGIHLHYIYDGNVDELSNLYDTDIEIKKSIGKSSLRRKLSKCNDIPIARISSGLPLKEKKMITEQGIKDERHLRNLIKKGLRKEVFPNTKPSIDYIYKILDDAYQSGMSYDIMDMAPDIQQFAMSSSHQAQVCIKTVSKMHFKSDDPSENVEHHEDTPIIFFDIEVFPNLLIVCWKKQGSEKIVKLLNPDVKLIEDLCSMKVVGFNNRRYDNHILYAKLMAYTNEQLFKLSQRIVVDNDKNALFGEAYNLSYTDVYDFLSAANKMSLKKWEIKLGIHHLENAYSWDEPLDEKHWNEVADYCANDVIATEAVWNANQSDWEAREMLAEISGLTVNDTTNQHTTRIIVGKDPRPQDKFIYTDLSTIYPGYEFNPTGIDKSRYNEGAKIVAGKSIYKGKDPGEGGYAIGNPGIYYDVALLDVESMHPHSAIRLKIFGEEYTARFKEIVDARLAIKHKEYEKASKMMEGKLAPYLKDPKDAKKVANALKTAINSVYGLTSASFPNKLKDPRNNDNIVAKYGALFMINLEEEVKKKGFTVVHIKTDSIKIANATPEIISFCMDYAKSYGYKFNHEATYKKMCIVNDAVYIAKYAKKDWCQEHYNYIPEDVEDHEGEWTATGKQFQIPYVFKTLFSHEKIEFKDMCETFSTNSALYLDMNEGLPDISLQDAMLKELDLGFNRETGVICWDYNLHGNPKYYDISIFNSEDKFFKERDRLIGEISKGHNYKFVGKVGEFTPIKPGCGGGALLREQDGKYYAATGTKKQGKIPKGEVDIYYWLESETVKILNKEKDVDKSYYISLVDDAVDTISQFGDFEEFVS